MYIENFLTNLLVKEFWKSVHICQSYYQTSRGLVFFGIRCRYHTVCDWLQQINLTNFYGNVCYYADKPKTVLREAKTLLF